MTDFEWYESRIQNFERLLQKAEAHYHITVTHGTMEDRRSALAECQELRAKLIECLHKRDELTGGDNHAKNQR